MSDRSERFGDSGELVRYQSLELAAGERSYFSGENGVARMDVVRATIQSVRDSWRRQNGVPPLVRSFVNRIETFPEGTSADTLMGEIEASLRENPDWADRLPAGTAEPTYPLIRLYTRVDGYDTLFANVNAMYRHADPLTEPEAFTAMTWLVELLTMELFSVSWREPERRGQGTVYRGMTFPGALFPHYSLFGDPELGLPERAVSIPLGFHSTSKSKTEAEKFFRSGTAIAKGPDRFNVLWRIEISSLDDLKRGIYYQRYPSSIVSPACATDISHLSKFRGEDEVLLRGPFFQVLDFTYMDELDGIKTYVLDALMLESNRDHISTLELGDRDVEARKLFNALVGWERSSIAAELATRRQNHSLAEKFRAAARLAEQGATDAQ